MSDPFNPKIITTVKSLRKVGKVVAYHPQFAKAFGVKEAVFLSQMIFWEPNARNNRGDGWVYKSSKELYDETGLSYKEQLRIRQNLSSGHAKIIEVDYERLSHRLWIRIDHLALDSYLQFVQHRYQDDDQGTSELEDGHIPKGEVPPSQREDGDIPKGKMANSPTGISLLESESTTENTAETTPTSRNSNSGLEVKTFTRNFTHVTGVVVHRDRKTMEKALELCERYGEDLLRRVEWWHDSVGHEEIQRNKKWAFKNFCEAVDDIPDVQVITEKEEVKTAWRPHDPTAA